MPRARKYEVVVKTGPSPWGWEKIRFYYCRDFNGARNRRDTEAKKNPLAVITIRDADTLDLCG